MEILETVKSGRKTVREWHRQGHSVALIPTMGALHEGHLSLVRLGLERCDRTIATIFVNPTQFGAGEDLSRYPRDLPGDLQRLQEVGADAVFVPSEAEIYPSGFSTFVGEPEVSHLLEGQHREGHFRGVTTVVLKLFQILPANVAVFGQKDFQQAKVIQAMVDDLNVDVQIVLGGIVREPDGLAMSSRNRYLDDHQRRSALRLSQALEQASQCIASGETSVAQIESRMMEALLSSTGDGAPVDQVDYATLRNADTLLPIERYCENSTVALIAARVGATRLIDNRLL